MSFFSHLDCTLDIFFVEALINGVLLAGLLALLALGLNLIFGVIDVVWICYAELVMIGMYVIFYGNKTFGLPFPARLSLRHPLHRRGRRCPALYHHQARARSAADQPAPRRRAAYCSCCRPLPPWCSASTSAASASSSDRCTSPT